MELVSLLLHKLHINGDYLPFLITHKSYKMYNFTHCEVEKNNYFFLLICLVLLFPSSFEIQAQNNQHYDVLDDWSVGIKVGSNHYSGDLSNNYLFFPSVNADARNGKTIGAFISKRINKTFTTTLDAERIQLHDIGNAHYKGKFKANIIQFNATVDADLFYIYFLMHPVESKFCLILE